MIKMIGKGEESEEDVVMLHGDEDLRGRSTLVNRTFSLFIYIPLPIFLSKTSN